MEGPLDARRTLFGRLIDHAPLFPPASLALPEALEEDGRARGSDSSFALGRFVCPASRFRELPDVGRGVSVVLDDVPASDPRVEAVESPVTEEPGALAGLADEIYVEVPVDDALEERLDRLVALGLCAKVRCGGIATPGVTELARFVRACCDRELAFKATAGLHHAVRSDSEHGLLNLLAAAVFGGEEDALAERDPQAFSLDASGFGWSGRLATPEDLARVRRERLRSIGSCSFFEPIEELKALGMLPA